MIEQNKGPQAAAHRPNLAHHLFSVPAKNGFYIVIN